MTVPTRPLNEINEQAMRLLAREMGAADAARFISQFTTGHGDYTEERKKLFEGLTLDDVARGIRRGKSKGDSSSDKLADDLCGDE